MAKYISLGTFNKHYYKIFLTVVIMIIIESFYGLKFNNFFTEIKIFFTDNQAKLSKHYFIHQFFYFLISLFISFTFYLKEESISNEGIANAYKRVKIISFIIIFLWTIQEQLFKIYKKTGIRALDFWTIELLIISLFHLKMFNSQIYFHQRFAIGFSISLCILKIVKIFVCENAIDRDLFFKYKWLIPVGILTHILFMTQRSYVLTKIKWYIEIKNITTIKLLMAFNFIGTISFLCFTFIATFIRCNDDEFSEKLCLIYEDENNKYFENFIIYFSEIKKNGKLEIVIELVAIVFGSLLFFLKTLLSILIIRNLSPIYIIFLQPLYFVSYKIILMIATLISKHSFFIYDYFEVENNNDMIKRFVLDILGDVLCCIAFIIYLEIIEIKFCKCNYNLKKNISERGDLEIKDSSIDKYFLINDNEDIEEVNKENGVEMDSNE